ncbi:DUF2235 domain-containing protein [Nocardia seriolae]|uniref:Glutathione transferase n=1 Tax=Nocardia seriolae TaxID=37332 RepID=A0ABC8ATH4_9NOCA|nr:DUF2235 domain-containing protein [Nocardia seriolae]APA97483.1 Glutathione transferase [Nocardia seriolae]OJF81558.1 hypothetical protein NS14008_23220 [Nocardia seriolae]PSK31001.1 DUF2235 domain-containing protein [Nocardia seriolae]QOW34430.1 DUF2235 domain-containing protein [Nocardia seriolae]QUN18115.1 DUF2235 domain-containing protein [Nocardia seriolae]
MKRLVVCCDGTWKAESSTTVSNIVKIAETVQLTGADREGKSVGQRICYVSGPGSRGFLSDRIMGGAFGLGLEANLSAAYWQLALNWEPGDEIFIFGFSRGAYTARSLAGLINRLGILKYDAIIHGKYPRALEIYRTRRAHPDDPDPLEWAEFRAEYCHRETPTINFLGVFDTVGAMGVPGLTARRHRFHDLRLSRIVHCARQALAIDERRREFAPCLWEIPADQRELYDRPDRVKQVWFEGVHSDIGGGYSDCGLSDITLRWMIAEAEAEGLAFDRDRLDTLLSGCPFDVAHRHDSLSPAFQVLNYLRLATSWGSRRFYWDSWRKLLQDEDQDSFLASTVPDRKGYRPANIERWSAAGRGPVPPDLIEPVDLVPLPRKVAHAS